MGSLVRFLIFTAALIALLVFVVVPLVGAPIIGSMLQQAGLKGQGVNVSLDLMGPAILSGRAESVRVQAQDVAVPHGVVGQMDVVLNDVSVSDHTFTRLSGTLHDVRLKAPDGTPVIVSTVTVDGPASGAHARGTMSAADAQHLVQSVAAKAGVSVDSVKLGNGQVSITSGNTTTQADLRVVGRALVLDQSNGTSTVLVAPAPSENWTLQGVTVTPSGIQVDMTVDASALAAQLYGTASPAPSPSAPHASPSMPPSP